MRHLPTTALESDTMLRTCMQSWARFQTALPTLSISIALLATALGVLTMALTLGVGLMAFEDRTGSAAIPFERRVGARAHDTAPGAVWGRRADELDVAQGDQRL